MIQEILLFFEFLDSHPSLATFLQVGTLVFLYVTYRKGQRGRAKLHTKIEGVDEKVTSLKGEFDIHKTRMETELKHLNGNVIPRTGDG